MQTKQVWKIGDCLEVMRDMPVDSVDIIIADPPYYKIKDDEWDNQWKTFQDYLDWLEVRAIEMKRVLKNNGSLYMFGDDHRIAYIQVMMDKHFTFLNHLVWYKRNNQAIKGAANGRSFAPVSERILFYSLQDSTGLERVMLDTDNFIPLRQYFKEFQEALGIPKSKIVELIGQQADHCFRWGSTQWDLPTVETYEELCKLPLNYEFIRRDYEELRRDYEELRRDYEELRRPFNYTKGMYEVFDIPIISGKENTDHSTTKPIEVITRLIKTSMKDGAVVLDPFCGSGPVLEACMNLDLECIGIDISDEWVPHYRKRLRSDNSKLTDTWDCGAVIKDA